MTDYLLAAILALFSLVGAALVAAGVYLIVHDATAQIVKALG